MATFLWGWGKGKQGQDFPYLRKFFCYVFGGYVEAIKDSESGGGGGVELGVGEGV